MNTSLVNAISTIVHVVYKEFANYTFKITTQIARPTRGNLAIYNRISSHIHMYPDMCIFTYIDIHAIHWYIYIHHMHAQTYIHTIHTHVSIAYAYQSIITLFKWNQTEIYRNAAPVIMMISVNRATKKYSNHVCLVCTYVIHLLHTPVDIDAVVLKVSYKYSWSLDNVWVSSSKNMNKDTLFRSQILRMYGTSFDKVLSG